MTAFEQIERLLATGEDSLRLPYLDLELSRADLGRLLTRLLGPGGSLAEQDDDRLLIAAAQDVRIVKQSEALEPSRRLTLDDAALWKLFPAEATALERLASLTCLIGSQRAAHGLTVSPTPEHPLIDAADRIELTPTLRAALVSALIPAEASLLLVWFDPDRCWTLQVAGNRLALWTAAPGPDPAEQIRQLRHEHHADLALGLGPDGAWQLSTHLELNDLRQLLARLPLRDSVRALLSSYRQNARAYLASQPLGLRLDGLAEQPLELELAEGRLRPRQTASGTPVRVPLGLCRRLLDLALFSGGNRLGALADRLIPPGLRTARQEEQLLLQGELVATSGARYRLILGGGEHHPGGVLWQGEAFCAVLNQAGRAVYLQESQRQPLRLARRGERLSLLCPEWDETPLALEFELDSPTPYSWGPGSLPTESSLLAGILPGMRGSVRRGRLPAPQQLTIGGQRYRLERATILLVTVTGMRYRGLLDLDETRVRSILSHADRTACFEEVGCLPVGRGNPDWWTQLVKTSSERIHRASHPAAPGRCLTESFGSPLAPPAAPLALALPQSTRWKLLSAIATPYDSRGVVTVRLRAWLENEDWQGPLVLEQSVDLRDLLPEPVWADQVLRLESRWSESGLSLRYGGKTLLELDIRGENVTVER